MTTSRRHVIEVASELYAQRPDWVTFFREVLGIEGIVRKVYANAEDHEAFKKTEEYAGIQRMLEALRAGGGGDKVPEEPVRVITVRLPESLHEALKAEAHDYNTSMNHLCISKLLKILEETQSIQQPEAAPAEA